MRSTAIRAKTSSVLLKVLLPAGLGLGVTAIMYCREFDLGAIIHFPFTATGLWSILFAILFLGMKDFSLAWRYRLLCEPAHLTWKSAFRTNYLCEFTSAITPSAVGGSALIMAYLYREGVSAGRSTAVMISTLFLDEMLFVTMCPLCLMVFSPGALFGLPTGLSSGLRYTFSIVYILIAIYAFMLYVALFRNPAIIRNLLSALLRLPFLKRYEQRVSLFTQDLEACSREMKSQSVWFWIKAFCITAWAWLSRYAVACALFFPFVGMSRQVLILCRQFIFWVVMMITPTPGGSGVSEYLFTQYFSDMSVAAGDILFITCFWRILTYYVYLFVGFCILPTWMKKKK
jgi:uncharacterized protein (TIRG00374 family)